MLILVSLGAEIPTLLLSGSPEAQAGMVGEAARRLQGSVSSGEILTHLDPSLCEKRHRVHMLCCGAGSANVAQTALASRMAQLPSASA